MNHWQTGIIPYSWAPKNVELKWSGMDHADSYNQNPRRSDWNNIDITYSYNPQGFRCPDLNNFIDQPVNIALGCSFTEGIGLPVDSIWPTLVEQQTEYPMLNLGMGGGAPDTVARVLTNISGLFDIQKVYILWPPTHRLENYLLIDANQKLITNAVYKNGQPVVPAGTTHKIETLYPMDSKPEHVWAMTDEMNKQRLFRNQFTVMLLAEKFGFDLVEITIDRAVSLFRSRPIEELDFARDGGHWGIDTQKDIAKFMLDN